VHSKNKNRVPPSEAEATPQTDEHRSQPVEASEQTRTLSEQQGEGTVSGSGDATCEPAAEVNEVEALQAERDKIKDQLVRTAADFDSGLATGIR
jgi:molecular chaperone GrpE (heat shock protein)